MQTKTRIKTKVGMTVKTGMKAGAVCGIGGTNCGGGNDSLMGGSP